MCETNDFELLEEDEDLWLDLQDEQAEYDFIQTYVNRRI